MITSEQFETIRLNNINDCINLINDPNVNVFSDDYDLFFEAIQYSNFDVIEEFIKHKNFNPNYDQNRFFNFCIDYNLFKKAELIMNHPDFNPTKKMSNCLYNMMLEKKYELFVKFSQFKHIDLSYENNKLLQNSTFQESDDYFLFLIKNKNIMSKISLEWISDWTKNTHHKRLNEALNIFNF